MEADKNMDFDPDFSEYNPNIESLKRDDSAKEDAGFIANLIKKLTSPVIVQTD